MPFICVVRTFNISNDKLYHRHNKIPVECLKMNCAYHPVPTLSGAYHPVPTGAIPVPLPLLPTLPPYLPGGEGGGVSILPTSLPPRQGGVWHGARFSPRNFPKIFVDSRRGRLIFVSRILYAMLHIILYVILCAKCDITSLFSMWGCPLLSKGLFLKKFFQKKLAIT